jgi:hypothetical protein
LRRWQATGVALLVSTAIATAAAAGPSGSESQAVTAQQASEARPMREVVETTTTTAPPTTTTVPSTTTTTVPPTTTTTPPPPSPPPTVQSSGGCAGNPDAGGCWDKLAGCESGGDWSANTGNGYYGGIQFALSSWRGVGGTGYPHEHSRETQIEMGRRLWQQGGWQHWPACSRSFGWL